VHGSVRKTTIKTSDKKKLHASFDVSDLLSENLDNNSDEEVGAYSHGLTRLVLSACLCRTYVNVNVKCKFM